MIVEGLRADGLMHMESSPDRYWSTTNIGEACPGTVNPLGWSLWGDSVEVAVRDTFRRMGALAPADAGVPAEHSDRLIGVFYGRPALSVSFFCEMGNRLPGTSGDAIAMQLIGWVPEGLPLKRDLSRMHHVAYRMPQALVQVGKLVNEMAARTKPWWASWLPRIDTLDLPGAQRALAEGNRQFTDAITIQSLGVFVGVQSVYDQLLALIEKTGLGPEHANALMAGQGSHAELDIVTDLWELGRERIDMATFLARHGYHGPSEGDVKAHVWREDPGPVQRLVARYAGRAEGANPANAAVERTRAREAAERELLSRLPAWQRPATQGILKLGVKRIPLRGVAKASYLQALDVCRAAARRLGALHVERGTLTDPEDAFFFTSDELVRGLPQGAADVAAERRAVYEQLLRANVATTNWAGTPEPVAIRTRAAEGDDAAVRGIGASGGVAEGPVRFVEDPAFAEVDEGEIIVCTTTDPSWASVLFLASALVVDIGGLLSHAAVVARELGVPCVIGTANGTNVLRTGDVIRVDGNAGTVEIISRAVKSDETPDDVGTPA